MPKPDPLRSHFYQISKGPVAELREPGPRRPLWNLATAEQNVIGDHACSLRARITVQRCDYEDEGHFHVMSTERQLNVLRQRPFIGTLFTVAQKWHIFVRLITLSNLTNSQIFSTVRIMRESVIVLSLKIPLLLSVSLHYSVKYQCLNSNSWKQDVVTEVFSIVFLDIDMSEGSVTTHLRCSDIFINSIITNFLLILTVENFWKLIDIWWSYKAYKMCQFWKLINIWWSYKAYKMCHFWTIL